MDKNLLIETIEAIKEADKKITDIKFIAINSENYFDWQDYVKIATDTDYYSGYGGVNIIESLIIVFKNGDWLRREEYDGAEWFSLIVPPKLKGRTYKTPEFFKYGDLFYLEDNECKN